jgi:hypothetical protein
MAVRLSKQDEDTNQVEELIEIDVPLTREEYDKKALKLAFTCLDYMQRNIAKNHDTMSIKNLASTLEVITRSTYKVWNIALPKDAGSGESNGNYDKLLEMIKTEVDTPDGGDDG